MVGLYSALAIVFVLGVSSHTKTTLLEGDIALPLDSYKDYQSFHRNPTDRDQIRLWRIGSKRKYLFSHSKTGGNQTDEDFSGEEKEVIEKALKHISNNVPCLEFK